MWACLKLMSVVKCPHFNFGKLGNYVTWTLPSVSKEQVVIIFADQDTSIGGFNIN